MNQKYRGGDRERGDREKEQPGANDWQSFPSTLQVSTPFVAKKLTGSRLAGPGAAYYLINAPFFYFFFFFEPALPSWNVSLPVGPPSVLPHGRNEAVVASHLLQHLGQATQVAVREVLRLPQVQDHARGAGFGGKVVQIPGRVQMSNGVNVPHVCAAFIT